MDENTTHDPASVMGAIDAELGEWMDRLATPGTASLHDLVGILRVVGRVSRLIVHGAPLGVEEPSDSPDVEPSAPVPYNETPPIDPANPNATDWSDVAGPDGNASS